MERKCHKIKKYMDEREGDQDNLDICHNTYVAEERLMQAKNMREK